MSAVSTSYYEPTRLNFDELERAHGGELTFDELADVLAALGTIERSRQWWVGDALVYAERRFGEDTFSQLAEALELEPHTLTNYRYVSSSVEPSRRRDDLSWSHHAEVARLTPARQKSALTKAADEGWTVRQLRDYVALKWPQTVAQPSLDDDERERDEVEMNRRLERIELVVQSGDPVDADDVRWLLAIARRVIRG